MPRYAVEYATTYKLSTVRLHLAALSRWHADNGFAHPTRAQNVLKVLCGIKTKHATPQRRAWPLQLDVLESASSALAAYQFAARERGDRNELLRALRDRALILLGFRRPFRSEVLASMRIEEVEAVRGRGLTCRPDRTKTTGEEDGAELHGTALSRLCPVNAYLDWIELSGRTSDPVIPGIHRWRNVSEAQMTPQPIIPLLRRILAGAGNVEARSYSSHSLRRGFADGPVPTAGISRS